MTATLIADTDGLLDRCARCGGYGGFADYGIDGWFVSCTECMDGSRICKSKSIAVVRWNREQRSRIDEL